MLYVLKDEIGKLVLLVLVRNGLRESFGKGERISYGNIERMWYFGFRLREVNGERGKSL